jgi:hypothetical protein
VSVEVPFDFYTLGGKNGWMAQSFGLQIKAALLQSATLKGMGHSNLHSTFAISLVMASNGHGSPTSSMMSMPTTHPLDLGLVFF